MQLFLSFCFCFGRGQGPNRASRTGRSGPARAGLGTRSGRHNRRAAPRRELSEAGTFFFFWNSTPKQGLLTEQRTISNPNVVVLGTRNVGGGEIDFVW